MSWEQEAGVWEVTWSGEQRSDWMMGIKGPAKIWQADSSQWTDSTQQWKEHIQHNTQNGILNKVFLFKQTNKQIIHNEVPEVAVTHLVRNNKIR